MKIRENSNFLDQSMATVTEIAPTKADIIAFLYERIPRGKMPTVAELALLTVYPYIHDKRIGWHTHVVTVPGYGVLALTDGPIAPRGSTE